MEYITAMLSQFGFPVFVALWFMMRTEKVINQNTAAMQENSQLIKSLLERHK